MKAPVQVVFPRGDGGRRLQLSVGVDKEYFDTRCMDDRC